LRLGFLSAILNKNETAKDAKRFAKGRKDDKGRNPQGG